MKKVILMFFLFATVFLSSLTLEESIELAKQNNKELQKAREEVGKYKQEYNNVRGNLFPQISLSGGYQYKKTFLPDSAIPPAMSLVGMLSTSDDFSGAGSSNDSLLIDNDMIIAGYLDGSLGAFIPEQEQTEYSAFGQVKLDQVLFLGGKLINGINIAGKLYHLQEKKYFLTEQEIIFATVQMYYMTILADHVAQIQTEALEFANTYYSQVSNMYDNGFVSEYDLLRAELEVNKLQPQLMEAQKNKDLAEQTFKNFLGVESELDLSPELQMMKTENIELNSAVSEGLQKRIELELSEIGVDVSKVSLRYEKGNFLPTIGLSAEYNYFGQDASNIESDDWGSAYQVGIGFTMPLFTGLSNTAKKTKARHTLKQAKLDHQNLQELIETDITNSYLQWEANVQKTDVQKQNVALAEKGLEIANARYENQVSNQLEVIDAQLQLKMAKLSYINAEYSAKISYKKLLKAMGRKL